MPKTPRYNYHQIITLLKSEGFYLYRQSRGSHEQWAKDQDGKIITVPKHGKKTLSMIVIKNILRVLNH